MTTRDDLAALLATDPPAEAATSLLAALRAAGHPTTRHDLVRLLADPALPFAVLAHRYAAPEGD